METQRIRSLFENLYNGNPWLDVTIAATLSEISAEKAAKKPAAGGNSIWKIVNHLIGWRENVLQRINGQTVITLDDNYFAPVSDTSEIAWQQTLKNLATSQQKWTEFLQGINDPELSGIYLPNGHTHYEHIHGIIQHDAYHLGQIVLIAKHLV
jgi:uncharacterized damage-inducible protein DinB